MHPAHTSSLLLSLLSCLRFWQMLIIFSMDFTRAFLSHSNESECIALSKHSHQHFLLFPKTVTPLAPCIYNHTLAYFWVSISGIWENAGRKYANYIQQFYKPVNSSDHHLSWENALHAFSLKKIYRKKDLSSNLCQMFKFPYNIGNHLT